MIYALAAIILTPITVVAFAKWFKRNLDWNYPNVDSEGEVENYLAEGLAVCLAKELAR
jgi:hypothetical protein